MSHKIKSISDRAHGSNVISAIGKYWAAKHNGTTLPARIDLDPRDIETYLDRTFIAECLTGGIVRLRVAGQALQSAFGMDLTGMTVNALLSPLARGEFAERIAMCLDSKSAAEFVLLTDRGATVRVAVYPLLDNEGHVTRLLGAVELPKYAHITTASLSFGASQNVIAFPVQ